MGYVGVIILERERERASSASGLLRERERESKTNIAVFEWLGARGRARARTANAVRVPAGMFSLVGDSGMVLFVSGVSNLIVVLLAAAEASYVAIFGVRLVESHLTAFILCQTGAVTGCDPCPKWVCCCSR